MSVTIEELAIPADLDGSPDAAAFIAAVELSNEVEALGYGTHDVDEVPEEDIGRWQPSAFESKRILLARRADGTLVGRATYETNTADDADTAWVRMQVLPEYRRAGIGTALADAVEAIAVAEGKAKAIVYTVSPDGPGERLASPTGFGSVPADNAEVRFLLGRGYSFEQVERGSRLSLPVPVEELEQRLEAARVATGPDYAVHTWIGRTPEKWLDDLAVLATRMSTDEPNGGLDTPEDVWTADRVLEADERNTRGGRSQLTAAAEHLPSGRIVGFSELSVSPRTQLPVNQWATIVLDAHRGHRLGMLLKIANLAHLQRERPGHPSIITFNAEENRYMLSVNEAVGFVPFGYEGAWKKPLK